VAGRTGAVESLEVTLDFWRGRRVFVTGHTGFKGSWLSLWLQSLGAEVTGYALEPERAPSLFEIASVSKGMRSITGDVRKLATLQRCIELAQPEIVFHLAAQSLVRLSYVDPVGTYHTNVMGTVNLLEAVRKVPAVRSVVVVTSDKCYENRETLIGYRESDPMGGHDPYSSSKGCAELVTAAYRKSFFGSPPTSAGISSARAGNVIGGGDWARDRLIPDVIGAFAAGRPAIIRRPHAVRPWQHVLEPLEGYLRLAETLYSEPATYSESWNFGPPGSDARPVSWVVDRLAGLWGEGSEWRAGEGEEPHEAHFLKLESSKANSRLGWMPRLELRTGLEWVVEWYKAYHRADGVAQLTYDQIRRYEGLLRI
jgi:CDP-glucose 4,6-dehydratase